MENILSEMLAPRSDLRSLATTISNSLDGRFNLASNWTGQLNGWCQLSQIYRSSLVTLCNFYVENVGPIKM